MYVIKEFKTKDKLYEIYLYIIFVKEQHIHLETFGKNDYDICYITVSFLELKKY